jgi:hypothetical protein
MATFTATVTYTCTIEVECPDSKLKFYLENDCHEIAEYADLNFHGCPPSLKIDVDGIDIEIGDIDSICKSNGNEYEWDGEKLIKL